MHQVTSHRTGGRGRGMALAACLAAAVLAGCAEKRAPGPDAVAVPGSPAASALPAVPGGPVNARTIHQEVQQAIAALVQAKNARDVRAILACYDAEARVMTWVPDQERDMLAPLAVFRDLLGRTRQAARTAGGGRAHAARQGDLVCLYRADHRRSGGRGRAGAGAVHHAAGASGRPLAGGGRALQQGGIRRKSTSRGKPFCKRLSPAKTFITHCNSNKSL